MTQVPNWAIEMLRLTVFTHDIVDASNAKSLWSSFTNSDPDSISENIADGSKTVVGMWNGNVLQLSMVTNRIDVLLIAAGQFSPNGLPFIGYAKNIIPVFSEASENWLNINSDNLGVSRLAFAGIALKSANDKDEAKSMFNNQLPFISMSSNWSDVLVQINDPCDSKLVSGLKINRILKWMVIKFDTLKIDGVSSPQLINAFANRIEFDFNSSVEFDIDKKAIQAFKEISKLVIDIEDKEFTF